MEIGRPQNNPVEKKVRNKIFFDNLLSKIKSLILHETLKFINGKIKEVYKKEKLGFRSLLLTLNMKIVFKGTISYNKVFIYKTLKEIFSDDISKRYHLLNKDNNKILIERLLNEKDEEKRNIFENILNLTFLDIAQYLTGQREDLIQLQGLTLPEKFDPQKSADKEYAEQIFDLMKNIEKMINENIRKRRRRNFDNYFCLK